MEAEISAEGGKIDRLVVEGGKYDRPPEPTPHAALDLGRPGWVEAG